jgi:hypothetical protein
LILGLIFGAKTIFTTAPPAPTGLLRAYVRAIQKLGQGTQYALASFPDRPLLV